MENFTTCNAIQADRLKASPKNSSHIMTDAPSSMKTRRLEPGSRKMPRLKSISISAAAAVTILMILIQFDQKTQASGVFELELIKLEPINSDIPSGQLMVDTNAHQARQAARMNKSANQTNSSNSNLDESVTNKATQQELHQQHQRTKSFIRIFVCLKEAFTSQLDGSCTFGNGSITLSNLESSFRNELTSTDYQYQDELIANSTKQQQAPLTPVQAPLGSPMTNIVRILFTFRWTKSFTIILSAEQIGASSTGEKVNRRSLEPTNRSSSASLNVHGPPTRGNHRQQADDEVSLSTHESSPQALIVSNQRYTLIDRHVLTENEILPNVEPNPNKPWTNRHSRTLKSSLAYRFRVYCSLNYYGDGCTTFCRPRDDQFGHYNCSTSGQKICLEGWQGPECDKAKCRPGCNLQHGYCDQQPDTCQCRPGWTGPRCDECITYPGCQMGYCLSPWQCICQRNWGGVLCDQDLNYCGTHDPCKNNGTCQNVAPGKYKCHCSDDFVGPNCEFSISTQAAGIGPTGSVLQLSAGCALNPCLNGGTCYGFNTNINSSTLSLGDMLNGSEVSQQELTVANSTLYRCQCPPGWSGDYCQWSDGPLTSLLPDPILVSEISKNQLANGLDKTAIEQIQRWIDNERQLQVDPATGIVHEAGLASSTEGVLPLITSGPTDSSLTIPGMAHSNHQHQPHASHMNMRHLISGVLIASSVGVVISALFLLWCCLIAIERNKFPFIQMNIIRCGSGETRNGLSASHGVSAQSPTFLRRMHEKIRNSLRLASFRTRTHIKPETRLSVENCLRPPKPPPSYEESSGTLYGCSNKITIFNRNYGGVEFGDESPQKDGNHLASNSERLTTTDVAIEFNSSPSSTQMSHQNLVIGEISQKELAAASLHYNQNVHSNREDYSHDGDVSEISEYGLNLHYGHRNDRPQERSSPGEPNFSIAQLNCPRHGHLYRHNQQQKQQHHKKQLQEQQNHP